MMSKQERIELARAELNNKESSYDKSKNYTACRLCVEHGIPSKHTKSFLHRRDQLLIHIKTIHKINTDNVGSIKIKQYEYGFDRKIQLTLPFAKRPKLANESLPNNRNDQNETPDNKNELSIDHHNYNIHSVDNRQESVEFFGDSIDSLEPPEENSLDDQNPVENNEIEITPGMENTKQELESNKDLDKENNSIIALIKKIFQVVTNIMTLLTTIYTLFVTNPSIFFKRK